jgi:toxin ParE1/3/4
VKRHVFHVEAAGEYAEAARYYAAIDPELGSRFYDEIERLIGNVCEAPERFRLFDSPIRRHFSNVFPYSVLYVNQSDRVLIVALMNMKRRPGYWRERIK